MHANTSASDPKFQDSSVNSCNKTVTEGKEIILDDIFLTSGDAHKVMKYICIFEHFLFT